MNVKLKKIICFIILLIIFLAFIAFALISTPIGWFFSFLIYGVYDALINGTIFVKIISTIMFLFLFTAIFELINAFVNIFFEE